jgi:hypothetical protein
MSNSNPPIPSIDIWWLVLPLGLSLVCAIVAIRRFSNSRLNQWLAGLTVTVSLVVLCWSVSLVLGVD